MAENTSDISCSQIGNLVYIKSDGIVIMVVTCDKEKQVIGYCENANWNSAKGEDRYTVKDMEAMAKESLLVGIKHAT